MILLSIIIPAYNVEDYIERCLKSLILPTCYIGKYEILVVDDGSTDKTVQRIETYVLRDPNIKLIRQENSGVSVARNKGVAEAGGKYVTFVDADDWVSSEGLQQVLNHLENDGNGDADILVLRSFIVGGNEMYPWSQILKNGENLSGSDVFQEGYTRGSVWGSLYKRNFLLSNDISFAAGVKNMEDSLFFYTCLIYAGSVRFQDVKFYYVYERQGSASRSMTSERILAYRYTLQAALDFKNNRPALSVMQRDIINYFIFLTISTATALAVSLSPPIKSTTFKRKMELSRVLPIKMGNIRRDRKKMRLLNFSYHLFYLAFFLRRKIKG